MSFSPRNVSDFIVAFSGASQAPGAPIGQGDLKVNPATGPAGTPKYKTVSLFAATVGGEKIADKVDPTCVTSIKSSTLAVGTPKVAKVTCSAAAVGDTASVTIDVHDGIGSPLNDRFINAYFTGGGTPAAVAEGLALALQKAVDISGDDFTVTYSGTDTFFTITEGSVKHRPGWNDGFFPKWDVQAKNRAVGDATTPPSVVGFVVGYSGGKLDDLIQAKNVEWFNSGYNKDPYREMGYPASFETDSNIVAAGVTYGHDVTIIQYYKDRDATNVERQHKQLIIIGSLGVEFAIALRDVI